MCRLNVDVRYPTRLMSTLCTEDWSLADLNLTDSVNLTGQITWGSPVSTSREAGLAFRWVLGI